MKFIICGGRDYNDFVQMNHCLSNLHKKVGITEIIHGGALGADSMAGTWGELENIPVTVVPADWEKEGKSADVIRNQRMLDMNSDGIVAFPGGKGTAHMIYIAEKANIMVWKILAAKEYIFE